MDGHRVRAREVPQEALSAGDARRMTSEIALSIHPKGRGSRPIKPQDEVSENDSRARLRHIPAQHPDRTRVHEA